MSDTTDRVSTLEQTLRDKESHAGKCTRYPGITVAYSEAADLVHERDAQLWALVEELEIRADRHGDKYTSFDYAAERLREVLEGKTNE